MFVFIFKMLSLFVIALAHLSLWLKVSYYCDHWMSPGRQSCIVVRRASSTIASNDTFS